jgi:hypothetical protein
MRAPTCDGWWWCRASEAAEAVLTRVRDGRYQPFGCGRDYDLRGETPPDARWQHAGLAESSPPADGSGREVLEPQTSRPLYVTYSYTRTGDHAPYRANHSVLMDSVADVILLAEAMHCPEGTTRRGGSMDVETDEGSRNDPEFQVRSVRVVMDSPLWPAARQLVAEACGRKQAYFDLLRKGRAHRRAVGRAQGDLREGQERLRQATAFLAEHEAHLNADGLAAARLAIVTTQGAVREREAEIAAMVAPPKPVGRPYAGVWADDDEIEPAPAGVSNEEGDD